MKVNTVDYIWSVLSVITVCVSYYFGRLGIGVLVVYAFMALIFGIHIFRVRKQIETSIAVYGTVMGYRTADGGRVIYPIVNYDTEDGREISSVYTIADKEEKYELGEEVMICYSPDNPMFFYFSDRKDELTGDYYRYILYGGIIAAVLYIIIELF